MIVVSDTTPLNYLVLVSKQDILPLLFGRVIVPEAVMRELQVAAAPPEVRHSDHRHSNATNERRTKSGAKAGLDRLLRRPARGDRAKRSDHVMSKRYSR